MAQSSQPASSDAALARTIRRHLITAALASVMLVAGIGGWAVIGNALALRQAAVDGLGPVLLADWLVEGEIRAGRLIDLFPDHDCTATEFDTAAWALYPSRAYLPRKVRVTIDFLRDRIGR